MFVGGGAIGFDQGIVWPGDIHSAGPLYSLVDVCQRARRAPQIDFQLARTSAPPLVLQWARPPPQPSNATTCVAEFHEARARSGERRPARTVGHGSTSSTRSVSALFRNQIDENQVMKRSWVLIVGEAQSAQIEFWFPPWRQAQEMIIWRSTEGARTGPTTEVG